MIVRAFGALEDSFCDSAKVQLKLRSPLGAKLGPQDIQGNNNKLNDRVFGLQKLQPDTVFFSIRGKNRKAKPATKFNNGIFSLFYN